MRRPVIGMLLVLAVVGLARPAHAQAQGEADRLREALRSATGQLRSLEDQRAAMQAKFTQSEREKQRAQQQADQLRTQLKEARDAQQQAVDEFNARLAERDATLEKWKTAYGEAAGVAREKDAERAKFQGEATSFKARTKRCEAKNAQLLKVSQDILVGYRDLNLVDNIAIHEPLIGFALVDHQNKVQDFRDRILDQDVKIPAAGADVQNAATAKPTDQKADPRKPQQRAEKGTKGASTRGERDKQ